MLKKLTKRLRSGRVGITMLKIRLQRVGRRNHAEFRVVVSEHTRTTTSSKYVDLLGSYSPHTNTAQLNQERVQYWLAKGAQPSGTVHNLLITKGILEGKKKNVLPKKTPIVKEASIK
jgi:small subunit ribosomal protein S16